MKYAIEWDVTALSELGEVWDASPSKRRVAITDALTDIDRLLEANAPTVGESRQHPSIRWVCVVPVSMTIYVSERLKTVRILEARVHEREV